MLAASIFHFGDYTVREAKARLAARGIEVRLAHDDRDLHDGDRDGSA